MTPAQEKYLDDPTNLDAAKAYFATEMKENPNLKLFRVTMDGFGVKYDVISPAESEEEALDGAIESVSSLQGNDFDKKIEEIK